MRWTWCVVIALAACDSGAPSCKDAIGKSVEVMGGDSKELVYSCEQEGWSADVRSCVAKVTTRDQADACIDKLPKTSVMYEKREADLAKARAEAMAQQAIKDAQAAKESLDKIQNDLDALNTHLDQAVTAVVDAQNDADRAAAKAKLAQLQKEQYDVKQRVEAARAAAAQAERSKGVHISKECMDNPLAKGCS